VAGPAHADTTDLQAAALAHVDLMHGWSFEGEDVVAAGVDITGGNNLDEHNTNGDHSVELTHIEYNVPGFDASSTGASTFSDVTDGDFGHGDAFVTSLPIAPPPTFSWEVLLQTGEVPIDGGTWDVGYVLSHRPDAGARGYFLWQGTSTEASGDGFSSLTGDWIDGEATVVPAPLPQDNWYYIAGSHTVNTGDGSSQVDLYYADLTAGDTTLTHTDFANAGAYAYDTEGPIGIGDRYDTSGESFPGVLDEVYLYAAALTGQEFQAHLNALLIGEPEPIPGDADNSGFVDDTDLAILLGNWESDPGTITTWALGDFTVDTDVDDDDLAVLLGNWTGSAPGGAAVPEPATLALLGLGGLTVLRRRRK